MDNKNLLNMEDLAGVLEQLNSIEETESDNESKTELTAEEIASQRRYDEIIKKRKQKEQ